MVSTWKEVWMISLHFESVKCYKVWKGIFRFIVKTVWNIRNEVYEGCGAYYGECV
jgi:hypothetical protein